MSSNQKPVMSQARLELLSRGEIESALSPDCKPFVHTLNILQSVDSTNSYLLTHAINPGKANVCLAETQTTGRGRRGREWQSLPFRNLLMSLSWGFRSWPETITGLGLAVALTVTERLRRNFSIDVKIKWPNDIMVGHRKLAGILIDVAGNASGACNVVIGIGLNVDQAQRDQAIELSQKAAEYEWEDLAGLGISADRNLLAGDLLSDLIGMLRQFDESGFAPLATRWNQLSSYAGQKIRVRRESVTIQGTMQGVDESGALLVLDDNAQQHRFADSNVTVRTVS